MIKSKVGVPIRRRDSDNFEFCYIEEIDPSIRDHVRLYAEDRLALVTINGKDAIGLDTLVSYGSLNTRARGYDANPVG